MTSPGDPRPPARWRSPSPADPHPPARWRSPSPADPHPPARWRSPSPAGSHTVTVYTRQGCHLCDEAIAVVRLVADGRAAVELVDIDTDPALTERYTVRVPVVAVDGVEVAEYQIAPEQLEAALGW